MSIEQIVCQPTFSENGIVFVGEFIQHTESTEELENGSFINTYLLQYAVEDVWCGEVKTLQELVDWAPEWIGNAQNTETEVWVAIQIYNDVLTLPSANQRQLIHAHYSYGSIYVTQQTSGTTGNYSLGPIDVSDEDMISGMLTNFAVEETMALDDFKNIVSDCAACTTSSGIDEMPINFNLYPNPVNEIINLESTALQGNAQYNIYSADGKLVQKGTLDNALQIKAADLLTGLYFISVLDAQGREGSSTFFKE